MSERTGDYETGYQDGKRAALREAVEKLSDPQARWFPSWIEPVYRVVAILASDYFGGSVGVSGAVHPDFGKRQLSPADLIVTKKEDGSWKFPEAAKTLPDQAVTVYPDVEAVPPDVGQNF